MRVKFFDMEDCTHVTTIREWPSQEVVDCRPQLEAGKILFFPQTPFEFPESSKEFLRSLAFSGHRLHKNIAYRPQSDRVTGIEGTGDTPHSRVYGNARTRVNSTTKSSTLEGRKESHMLQSLAVRLRLANMRAEEGQALIEYALIVSLISVIAIAALTLTGTSVRDMLNFISSQV